MATLSTIKLGGWLGKKYGKTFKLAAKNPKEAVAMMAANFPEFRADVLKSNFRVLVNEYQIDESEVEHPSVGKCIRFVPVLGGSGNGLRIVAGIVLVVVGAIYENPTLMSMGYSLIVGGVVGLMFGTEAATNNESSDSSKTSYLFGGTVNTVGQGNPVPLLYGERIVGSQVISAGISTEPL